MSDRPNFSGVWKLNRGESEFAFLQPPRLRIETIEHAEPQIRFLTRQIDSNGDNTVERCLSTGAEAVEIMILRRARLIAAFWDADDLVIETRSNVSGTERLLEDRWSLDSALARLTVTRVQHQPGGAVRQILRFRLLS